MRSKIVEFMAACGAKVTALLSPARAKRDTAERPGRARVTPQGDGEDGTDRTCHPPYPCK